MNKRLTQEVFDLPECSEWVESVAVDAGGGAWFYSVGRDDKDKCPKCKGRGWVK